jgi:hypothetical protein
MFLQEIGGKNLFERRAGHELEQGKIGRMQQKVEGAPFTCNLCYDGNCNIGHK